MGAPSQRKIRNDVIAKIEGGQSRGDRGGQRVDGRQKREDRGGQREEGSQQQKKKHKVATKVNQCMALTKNIRKKGFFALRPPLSLENMVDITCRADPFVCRNKCLPRYRRYRRHMSIETSVDSRKKRRPPGLSLCVAYGDGTKNPSQTVF